MAQVLVQERLLKKIENTLDQLLKREELISEKEAAKFLGISSKTMINYVASKKIPASVYEVNVLGNRMYRKSKLITV